MTERERLLKVLKGETPDRVPWFADLGHWYNAESGLQWNLYTRHNCFKEMIELHKNIKAGWYAEVGSLHEEYYEDGVVRERDIKGDSAVETFKTPIGQINMIRRWNSTSYSWDIEKLMVENYEDLRILTYATERKKFRPIYGNWQRIEGMGEDVGLGFPNLGHTGLGSLISYYMRVENTIYCHYDEPKLLKEFIDIYNQKQLELVDLYCKSPAPHMIFSDNLSSDIQPPELFKQHSFQHYRNIADRFHKAGKTVSAHMDGRLNGLLELVAESGVDIADAVTPVPSGDLTPLEIRKQSRNMVLMGGISAIMWLPITNEKDFIAHVKDWLILKKINNRLILSSGDQVPPGTELKRIKLVYNIVEEYGRY